MKKIGQITIKKIGKKYSACISGNPQKLFTKFKDCEEFVKELRKKYGRRHYKKSKKKKC